jgi:hypothetical protein
LHTSEDVEREGEVEIAVIVPVLLFKMVLRVLLLIVVVVVELLVQEMAVYVLVVFRVSLSIVFPFTLLTATELLTTIGE